MALTRQQKEQRLEEYKEMLDGAQNIVVLKQEQLTVNESNKIRMGLEEVDWKMKVIKKRVFMKALENDEVDLESIELEQMEGSIVLLMAYWDKFAPLKVIDKAQERWEDKEMECNFEYLGGWFEDGWKGSDYVSKIASIPSRKELISKFAFTLNYGMQSLAKGLKEIADQKEENEDEVDEGQEDSEQDENDEDKQDESEEEDKGDSVSEDDKKDQEKWDDEDDVEDIVEKALENDIITRKGSYYYLGEDDNVQWKDALIQRVEDNEEDLEMLKKELEKTE